MMIMRFNKETFLPYFICFLYLASVLDSVIPGLRYAKYFVIPISLALLASRKFEKSEVVGLSFPLYLSVSLLYIFVFLIFGRQITIDDVVFVACYVLPFYVLSFSKIDVEQVFKFVVIIFFLTAAVLGGFETEIDILNSSSGFEHDELGFILVLFVIFFYNKKNWKYFIVALVLSALIMKRSSLVALFLAIVSKVILDRQCVNTWYLAMMAAIANLMTSLSFVFVTSDVFDFYVFDYFGISSNHLLQGRVVLYASLLDWSPLSWLYGIGPGGVYDFTKGVLNTDGRILLHSDILKLAAEFGLLFVPFFFFLLYSNRKIASEYTVLVNIILITDNVLFYPTVMFFYILIGSYKDEGKLNVNVIR